MSLKHTILGFLSFVPLTGYDLKKAFDRSVQHFWPANQSQIYRTLAELEEQGFVVKEIVPREERLDLKIYSITTAGRSELRRWLSTPLPELGMREPFLIQVYFSGQLGDHEIIHIIQTEMEAAQKRIRAYQEIYHYVFNQSKQNLDPRSLYLSMLTLEYGLASNQAFMQWAQTAIQRINAGDFSPADLTKYEVTHE